MFSYIKIAKHKKPYSRYNIPFISVLNYFFFTKFSAIERSHLSYRKIFLYFVKDQQKLLNYFFERIFI